MGFSLVWQQLCFPRWEIVCCRPLGMISGTENGRTCNISVQYIYLKSKVFFFANLRHLAEQPPSAPDLMTFYLLHPLPLVFGRKLFVCNQAFQQLMQGGLGPYRLLFFSFRPADLFTKGWRGAEICI